MTGYFISIFIVILLNHSFENFTHYLLHFDVPQLSQFINFKMLAKTLIPFSKGLMPYSDHTHMQQLFCTFYLPINLILTVLHNTYVINKSAHASLHWSDTIPNIYRTSQDKQSAFKCSFAISKMSSLIEQPYSSNISWHLQHSKQVSIF